MNCEARVSVHFFHQGPDGRPAIVPDGMTRRQGSLFVEQAYD